jgi:hypothetical protein
METQPQKKAYRRPAVVELGSIQDLTLANGVQNHIDANFPANTPVGQLTFS